MCVALARALVVLSCYSGIQLNAELSVSHVLVHVDGITDRTSHGPILTGPSSTKPTLVYMSLALKEWTGDCFHLFPYFVSRPGDEESKEDAV